MLFGSGYALSSVEGRVAMEFFDTSDSGQAKKYALLHSFRLVLFF